MNTLMFEHAETNEHHRVIRDVIGYTIVGPIGKTLACGDIGMYDSPPSILITFTSFPGLGAMTEWKDIVQLVVHKCNLNRKQDLPHEGIPRTCRVS